MRDFPYSVAEIVAICDGNLAGDGSVDVSSVVTDTRDDVTGALFVALRGENFDGHNFAINAARGGAGALLVSKYIEDVTVPQIVVKDTLVALTAFAASHVAGFIGKVAAVTGSSGKTTTRSILSSILGVCGKTHQPENNFNNHIGVPLTALKLSSAHKFAVFELGCSGFGEIGPLADIVHPDAGVITNVGPAHLENLKDLNGVAKAKGELFDRLKPPAAAVINLDDINIKKIPVKTDRCVTFGKDKNAMIRLLKRSPVKKDSGIGGQILELAIGDEKLSLFLKLLGLYNALDALAATATAYAMGVSLADIAAGVALAAAPHGRLNIIKKRDVSIIDDTYNANPASMSAALDVLKEISKPEQMIVILGDMLELGDNSSDAHTSLGKEVAQTDAKILIVKGDFKNSVAHGALSAGMDKKRVHMADDDDEIIKIVSEILEKGDILLIKGSRGMRMEKIVERLLKE